MARKILRRALLLSIFLCSLLHAASSDRTFCYRILHDDLFMIAEKNMYLVQPESIVCDGSMLYFAAQDFTAKRELVTNKKKEIKVLHDEDDRKTVKMTFSMKDEKDTVHNDYELVLFLEVRKGAPYIVVYSKFVYKGGGRNQCGINWAMEGVHKPFIYYTIPHRDETKTGRLVKTRRSKIGQANWIFANAGDGTGAGLIAPASLLGRGENFIFLNSVPSKKQLAKGESLDTFMIYMPINKNFKVLSEIFEEIKDVKWEFE